MGDISMCANDDQCPVKSQCYRSTASGTKPTEQRQSWMAFQPSRGVSCRGFVKPVLRDSLHRLYSTPSLTKEAP